MLKYGKIKEYSGQTNNRIEYKKYNQEGGYYEK